MYLPKHFEETNPELLHTFIRHHPLATLITMDADGLVANPIPMLVLPDPGPLGTLIGHVARANPIWRDTRADVEALVVFQGADGYISPNWYPAKREHGKVVPTWNYANVQARGPLVVRDDPEAVRRVVTALTTRHEAAQARPWAVTDAPPDYVDTMLKAIVAIELPIRRLVGKFKLSQNRGLADRLGSEQGLRDANQPALADAMRALREAAP